MTKIDFNQQKNAPVSPEVAEWMKKYGSNHPTLLKQWDQDTAMRDELPLLLQQLSYALQHGKSKIVVSRLLGRISKQRNKQEKRELEAFYNTDDTADFLL